MTTTLYIRDDLWHIPNLKGEDLKLGKQTWTETLCGVYVSLGQRKHEMFVCEYCKEEAENTSGIQISMRTAKPRFGKPVKHTKPIIRASADFKQIGFRSLHPLKPQPEPKPLRIVERIMKVNQ